MRRGGWVAGGVLALALAVVAWPRPTDPFEFLGKTPKESMGGGILPSVHNFGSPSGMGVPVTMAEVVNVRADYEDVLRLARMAGYRITRHGAYATAERHAGEPRLCLMAGSVQVAVGANYTALEPAHRTVIAIESQEGVFHRLLRPLRLVPAPATRPFAYAADTNHAL
jgi:hypothetical protein